jgi:predicted dithiol-disulfide oxidoreductase (DUF899 family)
VSISDGAAADGPPRPVRLSQLFGEHDTLLLYSFMFGPEMERPCPMCTSLLEAWTDPRRI